MSPPKYKLSDLESEVISLFIRLAAMLNLPRSVGEVYGMLYTSETALCMTDCIERLGMSKGAVSQAFKVLRSFGAIKSVYIPGSRREYFEAERELRRMTAGFLSEQVQPQLKDARDQLDRIEELASNKPNSTESELYGRIGRLRKWERKASRTLPFFLRIISLPSKR